MGERGQQIVKASAQGFECTQEVGLPGDRTRFRATAMTLHGIRESGALDGFPARGWIGGKGYLGFGMITPFRKPAHRDLLDWEKRFNTQW